MRSRLGTLLTCQSPLTTLPTFPTFLLSASHILLIISFNYLSCHLALSQGWGHHKNRVLVYFPHCCVPGPGQAWDVMGVHCMSAAGREHCCPHTLSQSWHTESPLQMGARLSSWGSDWDGCYLVLEGLRSVQGLRGELRKGPCLLWEQAGAASWAAVPGQAEPPFK